MKLTDLKNIRKNLENEFNDEIDSGELKIRIRRLLDNYEIKIEYIICSEENKKISYMIFNILSTYPLITVNRFYNTIIIK